MNADDNKKNPEMHQQSMNQQARNSDLDSSYVDKIVDHSAENKLPAPDLALADLSLSDLASSNSHESQPLSNHSLNTGEGGYLELLEERPVINKERLDVGKVTVTKHARTKTINVPIELVEEYITVRTDYQDAESQDLLSGNYDDKDILRHVEPALDSKAVVTINGKQIETGDAPIEIVLSRQVATITKDTYVIQEVQIHKTIHTHTDSIEVALQHEELEVNEEGFLAHKNRTDYKK